MATTPDLDRMVLRLEDGSSFDLWTEATVEDSFLDPCQTMRLRVGVDESRFYLVMLHWLRSCVMMRRRYDAW
jgi:hypothetical protein